ncbi:MAG: hypothetical protein GX442_03335 [Candidatus Riflebacteria bacterium]|nr:hypothetical protein [Candidatus Riflebacteria bacterium]
MVRWGGAALVLALAVILARRTGTTLGDLLSPVTLKVGVTHLGLMASRFGWGWLALAGLLPVALVIGLPSGCFILPLLLFLPPWAVLLIMAIGQTMASALVWWTVRWWKLADPAGNVLQPYLGGLAGEPGGLTFWPRLFAAFPLRFLDAMAASRIPPDHRLSAHLFQIGLGNLFRMAIHVGWGHYLLAVLIDFRPFPTVDLGWLLALTLGEFLSFLLPQIPELSPAPPTVRKAVHALAQQS